MYYNVGFVWLIHGRELCYVVGGLVHGRKFVKVLSELTGVGCGGYSMYVYICKQ